MDPLNTFRAEASVIQAAPWSFAVCVIIAVAVVWATVFFLNRQRIENLESRIKLRDDEIADYKRKLDGATPDEAQHQIEELKAAIRRLDGPKLTADQAQALTKAAARAPGKLEINCDVGFAQGRGFTRAIADAFSAACWQVYTGNIGGVEDILTKTITLSLSPDENRTDQERALIAALDAAGLEYECFYDAPISAGADRAIEMYVSQP